MNLKPYPEYKDSGVAWLGQIPKDWMKYPGLALLKEKQVKNIGLKEKTVLSLSYGRIIIKSVDKLHGLVPESFETYQIVEPGDIIIRSTDLQNDWTSLRIGKVKNKGIITSAYMCFNPKGGLFSDYAYIYLHGLDLMKVFYGLGSGLRQNLSWADFKRMSFYIPSFEEQSQIARFLDWKTAQIAKFIKAKKRMIELLKEQKQVIINDAVTGKIDVTTGKPYPKYKDSGVEWLEQVPEGWEVRKLQTLAKVKASGVDKHSFDNENKIKLCNYVDVYKNNFISLKLNFMYATATDEEIKAFLINCGDIIITKDSESWKDIAVPALAIENFSDLICGYHLCLIRPYNKNIRSEFIFYSFIAEKISYQFKIAANGVTRFGLSRNSIKSSLFIVPTSDVQKLIIDFLSNKLTNIDIIISRCEREIALIQEYRDRLIADVVTGKVDVRDIEVPEVAEEEIVEDISSEVTGEDFNDAHDAEDGL